MRENDSGPIKKNFAQQNSLNQGSQNFEEEKKSS